MNYAILQEILFLVILIVLSIPLGIYIYKVMTGKKVFISKILLPLEKTIYKWMGIRDNDEMSAKKYSASVIIFSLVNFIVLFLILVFQAYLPLNSTHMSGVSLSLAFNTAASFVTNTNWQAYSGESTLSYFSQMVGLTVQNFVSAAVGIAVLFAFLRGFIIKEKKTIGCFWHDLIRAILYILIPLSLILAVILVSQGVVQTFSAGDEIATLQDKITQFISLGPAASQIAIKQLGTNGGGFFGVNSAYPFENPNAITNFLECLSILLIPSALCISFGKAVNDRKQGRSILVTMLILFVTCLAIITISEYTLSPVWQGVAGETAMEGKETVDGVGMSSLWSTATTAASNGSVNAMHDSFTPLSGLMMIFLMQLGEIVFGGVGCGLYGMLAFVILTVFIAGLMVGRTPEYLGKKIGPFDMKMVCIVVLTPILCNLFGTAAAVLFPGSSSWLTNSGAHGFSEIMYAFSSMAANNGSAFGGFLANTTFTNVIGGCIMIATRFIPMIAVIFLAGSMASKKTVAASEGTLSTTNVLFVGLLIAVILIVGALSFLPALALGPIADYFTTLK